ncbi:hypothetical protein BDY19DRAFT_1057797 [Irpex rosettiformis]|uniref:Uncharacterized protein n=1 Tax=Irpex rosettiformis TaxID=378272 RepID=A0ACB8U120_9APHY|nr:hypothetical protein BDY19DRAFT_1057797 [Irpex rosettiformis]
MYEGDDTTTESQTRATREATIKNMVTDYQNDLKPQPVETSFENCLLFLLSYVLGSENRDELKKELDQLYRWALDLYNTPPAVFPAGKSRSKLTRDIGNCNVKTTEYDRYEPFVKLANKTLEAWELFREELESTTTNGLGFRSPDDKNSLIFQRNDFKSISSTHENIDSYPMHSGSLRSPDIVALPLRTAVQTRAKFRRVKLNPKSWATHAKVYAPSKPHSAPEDFSETLMCWEFKMRPKHKMPTVPTSYGRRTLSECETEPPLSLTSNSPKPQAQPAQPAPTPSQASRPEETGPAQIIEPPPMAVSNGDSACKVSRNATSTKTDGSRNVKSLSRHEANTSEYLTLLPEFDEKEMVPAAIQSAIYAAERLCSSVILTHALNAVIIDEHLWLTWYEHGGCTQTHGLNFVTDFPYLMVLLVILKYFDDVAWGECREAFSTTKDGKVKLNLDNTEFLLDAWRPSKISLFGRGTNAISVTSKSRNPLDSDSTLEGARMTAKIYWPEEARQAEDQILEYAYAVSKQDDVKHVRGHLPVLVASSSFHTKDNRIVKRRELLEIGEGSTRFIRRYCRILVSYTLKPIQNLVKDEFMIARYDCFRCHFELWLNGLHHRDISTNNLMYYRDAEGHVVGVLNDFDLSIVASLADEFESERTGTMAFMATHFMQSDGKSAVHIYEYDVESFIYILLWITRRHGLVKEKAKLFNDRALLNWIRDNSEARETAHTKALKNAWRHANVLQEESNVPLKLAHGEREDVIAKLCTVLLVLKIDAEKESVLGLSVERTVPEYIKELYQRFAVIVEKKDVLRDCGGRKKDVPSTELNILAEKGEASFLWRTVQQMREELVREELEQEKTF